MQNQERYRQPAAAISERCGNLRRIILRCLAILVLVLILIDLLALLGCEGDVANDNSESNKCDIAVLPAGTTYSLTIEFDTEGLDTLNAASQLVTIVKFDTFSTNTPVVWLAFHPQENNTVTWTASYSVYSSGTPLQVGNTIEIGSSQQATGGNTYTFSGGFFDSGIPGVPINEYAIDNQDMNFPLLSTGLTQLPTINGRPNENSPLNATVVPFNERAIFIPFEKIQIFAGSNMNSGLILSPSIVDTLAGSQFSTLAVTVSRSLTVDFTNDPSKTIHYNNATNTFALGPLSD